MFIRRSPTRNKTTGESYFSFRLVRTERVAGKVRQITLLNLGRHFPLPQEDWPALCGRIEPLTHPTILDPIGQAASIMAHMSVAIFPQ